MSEEIKYDELVIKEGTYQTTLTKKYLDRKPYRPANPKHILSYIPGEVTGISVREGQQVSKGDELMTYKAMKMENRIQSPFEGRVKSVAVQVGDNLPKGALMIEFE